MNSMTSTRAGGLYDFRGSIVILTIPSYLTSAGKDTVPADGVYQLSNDLIRRAGFAGYKVKIYGYGRHLQDEELTARIISYRMMT